MAKIVIVEDSPSQAAIIAEIVKEGGHEPLLIKDLSKNVVSTILGLGPDLVLLDLLLSSADGTPLADGFHICREIKRQTKNSVGVVVVSAQEDDISAEWALMQGADAYLQKPFAVEDLLAVIKEALMTFGK